MSWDIFSKSKIQYFLEKLKGKFVQKETGKGLSTNDFDNTYKSKVDKIDVSSTSVSGNPISISGLKANQLAVNPIITLEPIQAGSGTPSPSNVRAISGYDKIEVLSCGKNIWADGDIGGTRLVTVNLTIPLEPGTYKISAVVTTQDTQYDYCLMFDPINNVPIGSMPHSTGSQRVSTTMNIANKCTQIIFYAAASWLSSADKTFSYKDIQIEKGGTVTDYSPYNKATSISESLGQTVYWGELDARSGKFKVLGGRVDLGSIDWDIVESASAYKDFRNISMANVIKSVDSQAIANGACEIFAMTSRNDQANNHPLNTIAITLNGYIRVIANASYTDATAFKTDMSGVYFVYELATPFYIQLTPHEISLLKDYAYLSTNGTNISLDYHNGELATHADVEQLAETLNALGDAYPVTIFEVPIAGKAITSYYGEITTDIDLNTYVPITIADGTKWDERCMYSWGYSNNRIRIRIKCTEATHTIGSDRDPIMVYCIPRKRVTP